VLQGVVIIAIAASVPEVQRILLGSRRRPLTTPPLDSAPAVTEPPAAVV
jgi:hypothetical protein